MARPKNPRNAFLSGFEEAPQPIYLLDAGQTLLYMNPACERWLGVEADTALGLTCQASALPIEPATQNLIRGLLPIPIGPAGFRGDSLGEVFAVQSDNAPDLRLARVIHLHSMSVNTTAAAPSAQTNAVLVLVKDADEIRPELGSSPGLADELRRIVAEVVKMQPTLRSLPGIAGRHPLTWRLRKQLEAATASAANVLIAGNEKALPELFARGVCASSNPEAPTLPTFIDGRLADEEQLLETLKSLSRRQSSEPNLQLPVLLLRADSLKATVQPLLRDWLMSVPNRVRLISTSSRSLLELASEQLFDLELAVRLSTLEIDLPTLSSRQSDVPAIASHWLEHHQSTRRAPAILLGKDVVDQLLEFQWTGDLEQLRSVLIQAATQLPGGGVLQPEHLPEVIRFGLQAQRIGRPGEKSINLDEYLEQIERLLLERALQQSGMNKAGAARLLGLTRQRFLRRCEHLQLNFPEEPIDFRPTDDLDPPVNELDSSGERD